MEPIKFEVSVITKDFTENEDGIEYSVWISGESEVFDFGETFHLTKEQFDLINIGDKFLLTLTLVA